MLKVTSLSGETQKRERLILSLFSCLLPKYLVRVQASSIDSPYLPKEKEKKSILPSPSKVK